MAYKVAPAFFLVFLLVPLFAAFSQGCDNDPASPEPPCSALGYIVNPGDAGVRNPELSTQVITLSSLANTIINIVNWLAWFIAVVAVVFGLYSGFLFITGGGDPAKLATARNTILWAIVGIAVAILAFSIIAITKAFIS